MILQLAESQLVDGTQCMVLIRQATAVSHVCLSICFVSGFWTNWPLTYVFACVWVVTVDRWELNVQDLERSRIGIDGNMVSLTTVPLFSSNIIRICVFTFV